MNQDLAGEIAARLRALAEGSVGPTTFWRNRACHKAAGAYTVTLSQLVKFFTKSGSAENTCKCGIFWQA
jgi:hypothetical protein